MTGERLKLTAAFLPESVYAKDSDPAGSNGEHGHWGMEILQNRRFATSKVCICAPILIALLQSGAMGTLRRSGKAGPGRRVGRGRADAH